jgi:hypothetical protein
MSVMSKARPFEIRDRRSLSAQGSHHKFTPIKVFRMIQNPRQTLALVAAIAQ